MRARFGRKPYLGLIEMTFDGGRANTELTGNLHIGGALSFHIKAIAFSAGQRFNRGSHELRGENRFTSVTPSAMRELAKKLKLDPDAVEADARGLVDRAMATFAEAAEPFDLGDEARRWRQHQEDVARAWI